MTPLQGLLSSSAAASLFAAAFAGSSVSGPVHDDAAAAASIGPAERQAGFCLDNATDSIIHYSLDWGDSRADTLAPGATVRLSGPAEIRPAIAFENLGGALTESYRLELKPATGNAGCAARYAFRYAVWSGVAAMRRRAGYFLFGPGIAADAYELPEDKPPEIARIDYTPIGADPSYGYAYVDTGDSIALTDWESEPAADEAAPVEAELAAADAADAARDAAAPLDRQGPALPDAAAATADAEAQADPAGAVVPEGPGLPTLR